MEDLKQILEEHNKNIGHTFRERDYEEHAKHYMENCVIMAPGKPAEIGRESAIEGLKAFANSGFHDMKLHVDDHGHLDHHMFYERGHTEWVTKEGHVVHNKYLVIRKKILGKPLVHTLIYNDSGS